MTHYKKDWFTKGAIRLAENKRFILSDHLLAEFLCYCNKSETIGPLFEVTVKVCNGVAVLTPPK